MSFITLRLYQVKDLDLRAQHTEKDTANAALQTAGQTKNMGDTVLRGADVVDGS